MRKTVPLAVAFLAGVTLVVSFFFNPERIFIGDAKRVVLQWTTIISGFALVLGVHSIIRVNIAKVRRRDEAWFYKLMTVVSVFAAAVPAIMPVSTESFGGKIFYSVFPESWSNLFGTGTGSVYGWLFDYVNAPMMETMFAMLAFYIASAAYRAFRARNIEATLLLLTATLVMFWRVPMGEAFLRLFSDSLPAYINSFIMGGFNVAVQRGIIIGAALGAASMSLRIILGIERTYMGRG
jgi:hypothetical protein